MSRGEYGPAFIGNGDKLPRATGYTRSYADVFFAGVNELDEAIQQADRDYAAKYQTTDQSHPHFVLTYWVPFVRAWNAARAWFLTGKFEHAAAIILVRWAERFNELKRDARAWGLDTAAPSVVIKGETYVGADRPMQVTPWWKVAMGIAFVGGAGYLVMRPTVKSLEQSHRRVRTQNREAGLKPGMSQAEQDRAWDAYYAKRGRKLAQGELVKIK